MIWYLVFGICSANWGAPQRAEGFRVDPLSTDLVLTNSKCKECAILPRKS